MAEEDTYVRAKLTEINGALTRMTEMLNKMIEVLTHVTTLEERVSDLALEVAANGEKLDELLETVRSLSKKGIGVAAGGPRSTSTVEEKAKMSSLSSLLDTLESQIRDGMIASDLAEKIRETAGLFEERGGSANLVVKMQRWVRILKTYGRVDPVNPTDLAKLRSDVKDWQKELAQMR
ncbi:MAG: hypothetical protein ACTSVD_05575 [Candidatus Thorarchaeota archaeon]|nr:MAG: hypothetical protein DRO93_02390 [Candidatus Thorarchaeota archaeon]